MNVTADELAGVVDLFGGLTRSELERALDEAAFRVDGGTVGESALEEAIDDALESYALVACEAAEVASDDELSVDSEPLFVAGPAAFPTLPEGAEDVPHILDVDRRRFDRESLGESARKRFSDDVERAVENGDEGRCRHLLEVSYDLEAWAPVDVAAERDRLEERLE
ncbi:DUF7109 family protein [Halopiger goleimassiliensis]|uniref:DUF7109 family protein n=1 Tax=Halopiger goleimassiliensis TaxID=1293048 RepID=UPI000677A80C|nr:hypothetical protein [Halopiger goleimassiliensis]